MRSADGIKQRIVADPPPRYRRYTFAAAATSARYGPSLKNSCSWHSHIWSREVQAGADGGVWCEPGQLEIW